jgi:hypothetical protein
LGKRFAPEICDLALRFIQQKPNRVMGSFAGTSIIIEAGSFAWKVGRQAKQAVALSLCDGIQREVRKRFDLAGSGPGIRDRNKVSEFSLSCGAWRRMGTPGTVCPWDTKSIALRDEKAQSKSG